MLRITQDTLNRSNRVYDGCEGIKSVSPTSTSAGFQGWKEVMILPLMPLLGCLILNCDDTELKPISGSYGIY